MDGQCACAAGLKIDAHGTPETADDTCVIDCGQGASVTGAGVCCPDDQVWDAPTGACMACSAAQQMNGDRTACLCPNGAEPMGNPNCCANGEFWDGAAGQCKVIGQCEAPKVFCQAPAGCIDEPFCTPDKIYDGVTCGCVAKPGCPAGQIFDPNFGVCRVPPECPAGQELDVASWTCKTPDQCPPGWVFSLAQWHCVVPPECGPDMVYNPAVGDCSVVGGIENKEPGEVEQEGEPPITTAQPPGVGETPWYTWPQQGGGGCSLLPTRFGDVSVY